MFNGKKSPHELYDETRETRKYILKYYFLIYSKRKKHGCINYFLFILTDYNNMFIERERYVTIYIFTKI